MKEKKTQETCSKALSERLKNWQGIAKHFKALSEAMKTWQGIAEHLRLMATAW